MAEQGPLSINVNLNTNAQQAAGQVDQFNQALGRVNQQARRIFASLQELSQRYQQQGFLGAGDQRTLEQGVRQWERMSQVLDLRRRGAEGRLQEAQAKGGEGAGMRAMQAQGVLERLTLHQEGLSTLRGAVQTVLTGPVPASPLQAAQMAAGVPVTPWAAGRFGVWSGAAAPPPPPGQLTPLQQAHAALQLNQQRQAAATTAAAQARLQQVQLSAIAGGIVTGTIQAGPIQTGPRRLTALQAAHLVQQQNVATAQHFTQMQRGAAAMANLPLVQQHMIAAQMLTNMSPLQQAHMAQFGMPTTPLQQAHTALRGQQQAPQQQGLQQAQLISLIAQMGPQGTGNGGGFLETLGAMGAGGGRLLGRVAGPLRAVGGLAVGLTAIQMLSQAMQAYEDRQLGILRVGRELDEQYHTIGGTLTTLRRDYFLTAREGVAAMSVLGRVTGNAEAAALAVLGTSQVARAYGMDPVAAAQMQAQLSLYSPQGAPNPLALVGVYEQARTRGELTRMSYGRFAEEATRVASVGGFGTPLMGEVEAGDVTRMMAAFGGRYAANPGAAFAEYYGRQQAPKSVLGAALNWQTLADVMQTNPQGVPMEGAPGGMLRPGRSYIDQQVLLEEGARSPAYRASQFARAQRESGGNRDLAILLYKQMTNASTTGEALREFTALEGQSAQPGGIAGAFQTAGATATGQAAVAGRERRPYHPGEDILRRRMTPEELAETGVVRLLEEARTDMLKTIQDTALAFNTSKDSADALGKIFGDLGGAADKLKSVFELMALIPGFGWVGLGGTAAITIGQGMELLPAPTQPRKAQP